MSPHDITSGAVCRLITTCPDISTVEEDYLSSSSGRKTSVVFAGQQLLTLSCS